MDGGGDGEGNNMTDTERTVAFNTLAAEGDLHANRGCFAEASESYTKALGLRESDKHCLVARSRCFVQMGTHKQALDDANECLRDDPSYFKGASAPCSECLWRPAY